MQCNKWAAVGVSVVCVVVVVIITYFALPSGDQKTTVTVEGDGDVVRTSETREVSLLHIEGLASAQRTTNWMTFLGFVVMLGSVGYAVFHYKIVRGPRRMKKDMDRERMVDRLHDIEEVLVELGHMRKKRDLKFKKKKGKVSKKTLKRGRRQASIEEGEDEEDEM